MDVRRIRPGDGVLLRAIRVRALTDAPTAFGQPLAEAQEKPDDYWEKWVLVASEDSDHAAYLGGHGDSWLGMAGGFVMDDEPESAMLYGMWVDPRARGTALAADLVAAVLEWAQTTPVTRVILWVTETNTRARRFYERCGFTLIDGTMPLRSHPEYTLLRMAIDLTKS